jgi:hypothetical protein
MTIPKLYVEGFDSLRPLQFSEATALGYRPTIELTRSSRSPSRSQL